MKKRLLCLIVLSLVLCLVLASCGDTTEDPNVDMIDVTENAYQIVYSVDGSTAYAAMSLAEKVEEVTGVALKRTRPNLAKADYEILIGGITNRDEAVAVTESIKGYTTRIHAYAVKVDGTKIVVQGSSEKALVLAVEKLMSYVKDGKFEVPSNLNIVSLYDSYVYNEEQKLVEIDASQLSEITLLDNIFLDGAKISEFTSKSDSYSRDLEWGDSYPTVTATPSVDGATVSVDAATKENGGVAKITVTSKNGEKTQVYTVNFNMNTDYKSDAEVVIKDGKKGAITFVFDDGYISTVTRVVAVGEKYSHIRASFAVIVNQIAHLKVENGAYVKDESGRYVYDFDEVALEFWRDVVMSKGRYEMVCHTYTHKYVGADPNTPDKPKGHWEAELIGANQVIKDLGNPGVGVVWAGASPANPDTFKAYMQECGEFIGNRYTFYSAVTNVNVANQILITPESLKTQDGRFNVRAYTLERYSSDNTIGKESTAEEMWAADVTYWKNYIDFAIQTGKWGQYCIHNVEDKNYYRDYASGAHYIYESQLDKLFAYANSKADELWMPTYSEGFIYYIQWSSAKVTATTHKDEYVKVTLTHEEEGDIYNMAMTVKVYVPEEWESATVNGTELTVHEEKDGRQFVYVDILPDETVTVNKG